MAIRLILSREIITVYSEDREANNKHTVWSERVRFTEVTARCRQLGLHYKRTLFCNRK